MLNFKSGYFYFLAIKIELIKFFKKIYFTTNYYSKSLKSQIPSQFNFYPNSFLLSSFTALKNFSFNVSEVDPEDFWKKQYDKEDEKGLHNFLWLNLIDRKNDGLIIQKIIMVWINNNKKYKKNIWNSTVVSRRIIAWIMNADIILNNTNQYFKENFFQSILIQINHLKKNIKFENNPSKLIEMSSAILLSGLIFKEYAYNFDFALKELKKLIEEFFDEDGFPKNRNPNDLIKFSKYLILIKECSKDAQKYTPEYLDEIVEKNLNCLGSMKTPENNLPLFNGGLDNKIDEYLKYIETLNYKFKKNKNLIGNIQIIKNKKNYVFFDVGEPPKKNFSNNYQSGPLSFEYFSDNQKIITNGGFGVNISGKARLLSRLTSSQSTLCINDTSIVRFEKSNIMNKAYGYY